MKIFLNGYLLFFSFLSTTRSLLFIYFFSLGFSSTTHVSHYLHLPFFFFFFFFFQFIPDHLCVWQPPAHFSLSVSFSFFLFLLHKHTNFSPSISHKQILSHTHIDHRQRSGDWRSTQIGVLHFFFFGLSSFILLLRFHQAYEKYCFCVSNLSIGFCVFVLIVVCFSL